MNKKQNILNYLKPPLWGGWRGLEFLKPPLWGGWRGLEFLKPPLQGRLEGCLLVVLLFTTCISPYKPEGMEMKNNMLVVEGLITSGVTRIRLSTSVEIDYHSASTTYAYGELSVERSDGEVRRLTHEGSGVYAVDMGELDMDKQYRLSIERQGELFQSPFLTPKHTPPVDTVYCRKAGEGAPVELYADVSAEGSDAEYYLWSYREDWEYHAEAFADADEKMEGGKITIVFYSLNTPNNLYNCWNYRESKGLILASGEGTEGKRIKEKKILEIPASDDRWSVLYRIRLKQNAISKEAYDYFSNLQKNVEQTGSIFQPIPTEMRGNITCVTRPELEVIGFVDVSTTVEKETYIPASEDIYEPFYFDCTVSTVRQLGFKLFRYDESGFHLYQNAECVDCTHAERGTKNRPEGWPSGNY